MSLNPSMNFEAARAQMLAQQLRTSEVTDTQVLEVLRTTPRESFVPEDFAELAFADTAIPIGHGQHMLTPQIEGVILQTLQIRSFEEVFEVGTGTGFLTACLARLGAQVHSIDIFDEFVTTAQQRFAEHRLSNIEATVMDAADCEWPGQFDVAILSAAIPALTPRFTAMLKPGGRLFAFTGTAPVIHAQLVTRSQDDALQVENLFETTVEAMINVQAEDAFVL